MDVKGDGHSAEWRKRAPGKQFEKLCGWVSCFALVEAGATGWLKTLETGAHWHSAQAFLGLQKSSSS